MYIYAHLGLNCLQIRFEPFESDSAGTSFFDSKLQYTAYFENKTSRGPVLKMEAL